MLFLEKLEQRKFYIILIMLICMLMGVIYTICFIPQKYISSTSLVCLKIEKDSKGEIRNTGSLELSKNIISTFEQLATSELSIKQAKKDINIDVKSKDISLNKISNSDAFSINIKNVDSNNILEFSTSLVEIFSKKVENILGNVQIYVIDEPHIENKVYGYEIINIILISILIGVGVSLVYIIFLIQFDKKIKNAKDVESDICIKNLSIIPINNKSKKIEITYSENSKHPVSNAFRTLRSNIQFVNVNNKGKNTILITSPGKFEGKSYIASNLAVSYAAVGKKVILIDADMENGNQSKIFNIPNNLGLSNYLSNLDEKGIEINELINKFINETEIKNLNLVTSGTVPPNSSELLTSPKLIELIKDLSVFYDVLIIDSSPVLGKTDALILTRVVNSSILVSNYRKTKKDDLWQAKKDIQNVGGRIIGNVLNKTKVREKIIKEDTSKIEKMKENNENFFSKFTKIIKTKIVELIKYISQIKSKSKQKLLNEAKKEESKDIIDNISINHIKSRQEEDKNVAKDILTKEIIKSEIEKEEIEIDKKVREKSVEKENITLNNILVHNKEENNVIVKNDEKSEIAYENEFINFENESIEIPEVKTIYKENNNIKLEDIENSETVNINIFNKIKANSKKIFQISKNNILSFSNKIKNNFKILADKMKKSRENLQENEEKYFVEENEEKVIETENTDKELLDKNENLFNNDFKEEVKVSSENIKELPEKQVVTKEEPKKVKNNNLQEVKAEISNQEAKKEIYDDNKLEEPEEDLSENEDAVLIIVDADNAVCRAFNKHCFTEKLARGIDQADGLEKAHYSAYLLKKRIDGLMHIYNLTQKQAERVDTLIYSTLMAYDDMVWIVRKMTSNKAEAYVRCITLEYEKMPQETKKEYLNRCQKLRKKELRKELIEIEYNLGGLWKTKKMNFTDKVLMNKFAGLYDIEIKSQFLKNQQIEDEKVNKVSNSKFKEIINIEKIKEIFSQKIFNVKNTLSNIKVEQVKVKTVEEIQQEVMDSEKNEFYNNMSIDEYYEEKQNKEELEAKREKELETKREEEERRRQLEFVKEKKREEKMIQKKIAQDERKAKKMERIKRREENKKTKELERQKQKQEARIEEELLVDNLYPKTKNNKDI